MIKTTLILILLISVLSFMIIKIRNKKKNKAPVNDIDSEELDRWKKERRAKSRPISLNVQAMGNNIEKSHDLWKELSKIVHEAKWIGRSSEEIELAAEFNSLINKHKGDYNELQYLETRIKNELLNSNT
ncbi:MAG: hypothetical protein FJX80_07855 [Bacteroidetes bacterium]|nr:hypothetical protein [Bacteroidota bacterium]